MEEKILDFVTYRKEAILLPWKVLIFAALERYFIALEHWKGIIWKMSENETQNLSKKFEFDSSDKCDRSIIMVKKIIIYSY